MRSGEGEEGQGKGEKRVAGVFAARVLSQWERIPMTKVTSNAADGSSSLVGKWVVLSG